ncbi:hypothetical protein ABS71_19770 [bacterium SCN 62-11]|nr:hypothetical protein [Candidatus Eremiobacteraeota bacterium]ODT57499.1 MAG: hypothetical protein ABS71_19770 [bacterium SCN 62-11]
MRIFLLLIALTGLVLAQGMFDLFEGRWAGKSPEGQRLQLHTGAKVHDFELEYGDHWVVRGEYRVTATKGQPHVSFKPTKILQDGHTRKYVEIEKWPLVVGRESKAILDYQDEKLQMDVFGPEIENYWRAELVKVK